MFDFTRITLFCLEKRLSKHKMTIFSKNLWGEHGPFGSPWLRLWYWLCSWKQANVDPHQTRYKFAYCWDRLNRKRFSHIFQKQCNWKIVYYCTRDHCAAVTSALVLDISIFARLKVNCEVMLANFKLLNESSRKELRGAVKARVHRPWPIWPVRKSVTDCNYCNSCSIKHDRNS